MRVLPKKKKIDCTRQVSEKTSQWKQIKHFGFAES